MSHSISVNTLHPISVRRHRVYKISTRDARSFGRMCYGSSRNSGSTNKSAVRIGATSLEEIALRTSISLGTLYRTSEFYSAQSSTARCRHPRSMVTVMSRSRARPAGSAIGQENGVGSQQEVGRPASFTPAPNDPHEIIAIEKR